MLSFTDFHFLGDALFLRVFDDPPFWVHLFAHVVIIAGPAGLLVLAVSWCSRRWFWARAAPSSPRPIASEQPVSGAASLPPGLFRYILQRSWRAQILLLLGAAVSMPILYATLELPKLIINSAISSGHFPADYWGWRFEQVEYLFILCLIFLAAVIANGSLKYQINLHKGRLAETLTRRLRLAIHSQWRRHGEMEGAEIIPVIVQEVEPVGGFSGDAFVLPVFQLGTFLTIFLFMFVQDPVLGAAAVSLLPIQLALVPRWQRRINALGRERALEMRRLGVLIGNGTGSVHASPASSINRSFRRIQRIRFEIYRRKFFVKGVNNFIWQMTPFFFYTIGGYLVIEGRLSFGALVAVLGAYKDFSAPLRELLGYYQMMEDARVRYEDIRRFVARTSIPRPEFLDTDTAHQLKEVI
ncbi:hypothetical protein [Inquilinus sp. Marseille-Q2685]|uniref:hypothetical protein n=1 Tax=Inquilinus sp. Marseille-Q2685 TaxID=2866581 RepID=UPI001CE45C79|nr:hypothetical protein [Inquilinus sp. Marseille-Q2685]